MRRLHGRWRGPLLSAAAAVPLVVAPLIGCSERDAAKHGGASAIATAPVPDEIRTEVEALRAAKTSNEIIAAIDAIQGVTDPQGIPYLEPYILNQDPAVAERAVEAIEFLAIATEDGIPVFTRALEANVPPAIRMRLLEALYQQRTEIEVEATLAQPMFGVLERDPDPMVRIDAAEYIAALGNAEQVARLEKHLAGERDERVRQAIQWSIQFLRNETQAPPPRFDAKS